MKGFSRANLMHMRSFADAWSGAAIVQQAVGQLPWGHYLLSLARLKQPEQRLGYAHRAVEHGGSRATLEIHIKSSLLEREGQAITNFADRLPAPGTDLARHAFHRKPHLPLAAPLIRVEPHRLAALVLEDLRRYPRSAISDIHQRVGGEIHPKQVKRALDELIERGEVRFEGKNRWRRYWAVA